MTKWENLNLKPTPLKRVFHPGQHHGERATQRTREAKQSADLAIPHVYMMAKDDREVGSDGLPKTCPVCIVSQTLNMEMSEWVTGILDAVQETEEEHEVISTEEMLHTIDKLNMVWQKEKESETETEEVEENQEAKEDEESEQDEESQET